MKTANTLIYPASPPVWPFALATLAPVPFLLAGLAVGGWSIWIAVFYIVAFVAFADLTIPETEISEDLPSEAGQALNVSLALLHPVLLFGTVWSLAGLGPDTTTVEKIGLFICIGLYLGQVSNSNAHELIHSQANGLRRLGQWVFISLLFGHHSSSHPAVHHRFVATPKDPNTARLNEPFHRFYFRAWIGSFLAGLEVERRRRPGLENPYFVYVGGAIAALGLSFLLAGWHGVAWHLALAGYAQMQLLLSDYVQHYGLARATLPNGRFEAVGTAHSWNAPHSAARFWMLNAPRHSDHHSHPTRHYTSLRELEDAPTLPYSLPVMGAIAFWPARWKRLMNPRVAAYRASIEEE
ncbi:MAG: alkane 1-monooxygenase [Pseudomonadota bacterium]